MKNVFCEIKNGRFSIENWWEGAERKRLRPPTPWAENFNYNCHILSLCSEFSLPSTFNNAISPLCVLLKDSCETEAILNISLAVVSSKTLFRWEWNNPYASLNDSHDWLCQMNLNYLVKCFTVSNTYQFSGISQPTVSDFAVSLLANSRGVGLEGNFQSSPCVTGAKVLFSHINVGIVDN